MLQNAYFLAKIGFDTVENEPLKVWRKIQFIINLPPQAGVGDLALLERDSTAELSDLAEEGRAQGLTMHLDDMDSAGEYHRTVPVVDGDGGRGGRGIGLFGAGGAWYLCEN